MESQRHESGRYLPEVRRAVIEEVRKAGVWAAVERFGVAFGTVTYWWGQERKLEKEAREGETHAVERKTSVLAAGRLPQANAPSDPITASVEANYPQVTASGEVHSAISEEAAPTVATLPTSQWAAGAAPVLELWSVWRGPLASSAIASPGTAST